MNKKPELVANKSDQHMYEVFFQTLQNKVAFNEEELPIIKTYLTPKKLRKKQYRLQEADPCKFIAFVEKGALRSYTIDEKGVERILQFAWKDGRYPICIVSSQWSPPRII
jgi:CRP-like cAMP-binding protein